MEEHKEWKAIAEKLSAEKKDKDLALIDILNSKEPVTAGQARLMLKPEQMKQDLLNLLGSADIGDTVKGSKLMTALAWALPSALYYGFFILTGDNLVISWREAYDPPIAHYTVYPGFFLGPGTVALVISTKYILGDAPRRKGDIFLLDPLKMVTGIAGMSAFHDMSGLWVLLKAAVGEPRYIDMWWQCWTNPNYEFFAQTDWWFFNWEIPCQHLSGQQFFALEAGVFAAIAGATYGIHKFVNWRRRKKEEKSFALIRLINKGVIPLEEVYKVFDNDIKNENSSKVFKRAHDLFNDCFKNTKYLNPLRKILGKVHNLVNSCSDRSKTKKNKKIKGFFEYRQKLENFSTDKVVASIEESIEEYVPSEEVSFEEYFSRRVRDKFTLSHMEELKKLQRKCTKCYSGVIKELSKVFMEEYKDEIKKEIDKFNRVMGQVDDEKEVFKEFLGKKQGKKLYNKICNDYGKWERDSYFFELEIYKMLGREYPLENVKLFLENFYNAEDAEKCLSFLEQEVSVYGKT